MIGWMGLTLLVLSGAVALELSLAPDVIWPRLGGLGFLILFTWAQRLCVWDHLSRVFSVFSIAGCTVWTIDILVRIILQQVYG